MAVNEPLEHGFGRRAQPAAVNDQHPADAGTPRLVEKGVQFTAGLIGVQSVKVDKILDGVLAMVQSPGHLGGNACIPILHILGSVANRETNSFSHQAPQSDDDFVVRFMNGSVKIARLRRPRFGKVVALQRDGAGHCLQKQA
jgi:hypothetical protein